MTQECDVVFSYGRGQAIADGVLRDVTAMAMDAGFRYPVALTVGAWVDCVAWRSGGDGSGQSESGRLWEVLHMARLAFRRAAGRTVLFTLLVVPRRGTSRNPQPVGLKMVVGPGDELEPVITILLPGED